MKKILFNIITLSILSIDLSAQNDNGLECQVGYGYYETFTIGLGYYLKDEHKIGISAGSGFMINNEMYYTIILEDNIALFRSKKDKLDNFKWYLANKISYWDMEDEFYRWNVLSLSPAITRRFSLTNKINFTIDMGPLFTIVLESYRKTYGAIGWPYHVMPNARLLINYRF